MRHAFLVLLAGGPAHGYELKLALEQRFGDLMPPVNAGQVYTTLARLERDGLVEGSEVVGDGRGKRDYAITVAGRAELAAWLEAPNAGVSRRDEFATKLVLGGLSGLVDTGDLIDRQRRELLQTVRDFEARRTGGPNGVAADLLIESAVLHAEAELRWLDYVSARLEMTKEDHDERRD
jgi:DNA-binding PadR family transcriptional regulator